MYPLRIPYQAFGMALINCSILFALSRFMVSVTCPYIVPVKTQSPRQRIDGTAALLDCYVGLYEHYNEFTGTI